MPLTSHGHFGLNVQRHEEQVLISVFGELDLATSPQLERELDRAESAQPSLLILDLSELDFMDSAGLKVVLAAHIRAERDGRRLAVVRGPAQVQQLFALTGLAQQLTLADTPQELFRGP